MSLVAPPIPLWHHLGGVYVQIVRDAGSAPPATYTSWYRDVETNRRVGGSPQSQHLLGLAHDSVPEGSWDAFGEHFSARGYVVIFESDHVHVQALPAGLAARFGLFGLLRDL